MNVLEERRTAEQRYRRRRNRLIIRTMLYLTSIVPAILVVLNFEAFSQGAIRILQGGEASARVEPTHSAPQSQAPLVAATVNVRPIEPVKTAKAAKPIEPAKAVLPIMPSVRSPAAAPYADPDRGYLARSTPDPAPRQPIRILSDDDRIVKETQRDVCVLSLKLARKRQRCPVKLHDSDGKLQILLPDDFDMAFEIEPDDGTFDAQHSAVISFPTLNPARIEVSIDRASNADKSAIVNLDFLFESDSGRSLPFSSPNLQGICRRTESQGRKVQIALAKMEAERNHLEALVYSSVPVPYLKLKSSEARLVELASAIPAAAQQVAVLANQLQSVKELIALADSLDGKTLRLAEIDAFH